MKRIILLIVFVLALSVSVWGQSTNRIILHSGATGAANGERPSGLSWNGGTITVSGTFTGLNAVAEISPDGSTFNTVSVTNLNGLTQSTTITAAGVYFMPIGRAYQFGVRVTAVTGTATIVITPTDQVLAKGSSGGTPSDATFITQTPSSTLTAEQALSALATGLLKNTTTTGVLSIAGASDLPSGIDAAKITDGSVSNAEFQRLDGVTSGIQSQIDGKQAALGFTPENVANKSTDGTLAGNSDTLYASQKATKTYADTKEVPLTFSSPLVRTVNAVACATCVIASSPGAGIAHFAGSTQTVTSSSIVNADIANSTIDLTAKVTGALPAANGGFGSDVSAVSGVPLFATGTPTFTSTSGSGNFVRVTSPTLVTPILGAATATTINGNTFTTGTYTLTGTAGKTLNFTNSLTLSGTDSTTQTFPATSATIARTDAGQTFTGTQVIGGMSFAATNSITGGAANMTITSGTGASRTMILQTTTSGSVATTALTLDASQNATFAAQVSATGKIVGGTGLQSSNNNAAIYLGFNSTNTVDLPSTVVIGVSSDATFFGTRDTYLTRRGAANWNLGNSANGTPVANTLTVGESGSGTNIAGGAGTIQSGTGTGTGTVATLIFQTPTLGSSGTTAQSYATRLTLDSTNATFTGNVVTPTVNATTSLKINGNALFLSTTPTISSGFGVTPSIAGIASVFKVTVGTGGDTSGVVAFNGTFANAPACMANDETSNVLVRAVSTTTGVTISGVMAGGDIVKIICAGY